MRFVNAIVVGVLLLLPSGLWAQQYRGHAAQPELDVAVTYSAQRGLTTAGGSFWAQGGSAELTATFYHGLGMAAYITGTHAGNIGSGDVGLTLVTATFGPTYTWILPRRAKSIRQWRLFGESLVGIVNGVDSVFPDPSGAQSDAEGMALQLGGGVDLDLSPHFALRLLQADWLRTQLPNATTKVQNNLQIGAGFVLRFQ
jgi:hypothetical protein